MTRRESRLLGWANCLRPLALAAALGLGALSAAVPVQAREELPALIKEGRSLREQGRLFEAIEVFRRQLRERPSLYRARLELAITYYQALDPAQARRHAEQVLEEAPLSERSRSAVDEFLDKVDALERRLARRHQWGGALSAGLLYDDNANVGLLDELGDIADPLPGQPGAEAAEDWALTASARIDHRYRLGPPRRIGGRAGLLNWRSSASLYLREYRDSNDFDFTGAGLATGPALRVPQAWQSWLPVSFYRLDYGGEHFADYLSFVPRFDARSGELQWSTQATLSRRDYQREVDLGRDSRYGAVSVGVAHPLGERWSINAGGRLFDESADDAAYSNDGHELWLGAGLEQGEHTEWSAQIRRRAIAYQAALAGESAARDETEWRYSLALARELQFEALADWTARLEYLHTERDSNLAAYTYRRSQVFFSLGREY